MRKIEGAFCARRPSACLAVWYGGGELRWADGGGEGALALQYVPRVLIEYMIEYTEGRFEN